MSSDLTKNAVLRAAPKNGCPKDGSVKLLFFIAIFMSYAIPLFAEDNIHAELLIAGEWGNKEGEFGIEKNGKTELGFALDFFLVENNIYILDSINDRVQIFDIQGNLKEIIKLSIKWQEFGLPWNFALLQNNFYMLIGKPPYYNPNGVQEIFKVSHDGKLIKSFGKEQLSRDKEEYYYRVLSDKAIGYIVCGINGNNIIAFDGDGSFTHKLMTAKGYPKEIIKLQGITPEGDLIVNRNKLNSKEKRTVIFDVKKKMIKKEISGYFSASDREGNYYRIRSMHIKRGSNAFSTRIDIYSTKSNQLKTFSLPGDIRVAKHNKEKVFHSSGRLYEVSQVDPEGNIYHLMAVEEGVILRKIVWKKMVNH